MSKCGHINKQFYNAKGELEDLACTLEEGHAPVLIRVDKIKNEKGELVDKELWEQVHSAEYVRLKADVIPSLKRRVEGAQITYKEITEKGEWTDAAGIPAKHQTPE